MCGRYSLTKDVTRIRQILGLPCSHSTPSRQQIAPTEEAPVVLFLEQPVERNMRWGFQAAWKGRTGPLINARSETLEEKRIFKTAFMNQRCLVLADGFYEWVTTAKGRTPMRFDLLSGEPFVFAGLWHRPNKSLEEQDLRFTILTTTANELVGQAHHRMPVILRQEEYIRWLSPGGEASALKNLCRPFPASEMAATPVNLRPTPELNTSLQLSLFDYVSSPPPSTGGLGEASIR